VPLYAVATCVPALPKPYRPGRLYLNPGITDIADGRDVVAPGHVTGMVNGTLREHTIGDGGEVVSTAGMEGNRTGCQFY